MNVRSLVFIPASYIYNKKTLHSQVIISGLSTPAVLTDDGILSYAKAIGLQAISLLDDAEN